MSEEPKGWKDRHFFSLSNPSKNMPEDNPSTLPDPKTNPAAYPDPEPGEAPTTPDDKEQPDVEEAEPAPAPEPKAPNPADPTAPPPPPPPTGFPTQKF